MCPLTRIKTIHWERLSDTGRALEGTIGRLLVMGYSRREIAAHYGKPENWVSSRVRMLREEIAKVTDYEEGDDDDEA